MRSEFKFESAADREDVLAAIILLLRCYIYEIYTATMNDDQKLLLTTLVIIISVTIIDIFLTGPTKK